MDNLQKTDRTTITRLPKRGSYDRNTIYSILDEALFCTLAYVRDGQPFQIPTGFCRIGDKLYIHGSVGSSYMRTLDTMRPLTCISVALMDGIVLARSAMHHSVNYRSVVLFGHPDRVHDEHEQYKALEEFTNKMQPGRWDDVRKPTANEWKATMVISFPINEASAKMRTGGPVDDEEDYNSDVWAGVVPLQLQRLTPQPDERLRAGIPLPDYLRG
ncbi:MAG: pyridoxamine 5'-phosphate oxidase family protein [Bacteroidota bacterium]|jgi:nitroimidazol reductase NimA-like FMN-containing flavoprotein (pyridoxamine 5'-phosphate oxidase superfamily)|nr:MAG: pyridoxamine 5'-phosphate oxidase [Bacteroidota bacterium]